MSKIKITQGIALLAVLLSMLGFDLSPENQADLVTAVAIVGQIVTWVLRTWFNHKNTGES